MTTAAPKTLKLDANDLVDATRGQLATAQATSAEWQALHAGATRLIAEKDKIIDALTADRAAMQKELAQAKAAAAATGEPVELVPIPVDPAPSPVAPAAPPEKERSS